MRLDNDTDPNAMDDELRADIMRIIPEKIQKCKHEFPIHSQYKHEVWFAGDGV